MRRMLLQQLLRTPLRRNHFTPPGLHTRALMHTNTRIEIRLLVLIFLTVLWGPLKDSRARMVSRSVDKITMLINNTKDTNPGVGERHYITKDL